MVMAFAYENIRKENMNNIWLLTIRLETYLYKLSPEFNYNFGRKFIPLYWSTDYHYILVFINHPNLFEIFVDLAFEVEILISYYFMILLITLRVINPSDLLERWQVFQCELG